MRYFRTVILFVLAFFYSIEAVETSAAVSYNYKKGRFGDQLLAFSHAFWFAYVLDLPLVYKSFKYSDQLQMHLDPSLIRGKHLSAGSKIILNTQDDYLQFFSLLHSNSLKSTVLEVPFYPESLYLYDGRPQAQFTQVNWNDPIFMTKLRSLIAPLNNLPKLDLPPDRVSVALHYRSGIVYDNAAFQKKFPLKGPPDAYYKDALALLQKIMAKPLYVRLFTDHPNPAELQKQFSSYFPNSDLIFDCRTDVTGPDHYVLEDFFAFRDFDCMIRPESNFSIMASLLFPFKLVISPVHYHLSRKGEIVVDQFLVEYGSTQHVKHPTRTILRVENE